MKLIHGKAKDLGDGFIVTRMLPHIEARSVGPFVFFDAFGPVDLPPGKGLDVRPHPHIGLATVTYLFEGGQVHRDSIGTVQEIRPGEVNWMTAGRGIVHSERTGPEMRAAGHRMHGIQTWVALPAADEQAEPGFQHAGADELPVRHGDGLTMRLVAGDAHGMDAPIEVFSPIFYLDVQFDAGARLALPAEHRERAVFVVSGAITAGNERLDAGTMAVFDAKDNLVLAAAMPSRAVLFGGAPLDGPRHLWWNFVASSKERIEQAKADWRAQRLGRIAGDDEFIPLPE